MKCPKCGKDNWPDATSCGECGAAMDGSAADDHRISESDRVEPEHPGPPNATPTGTLFSAVTKGLKAARTVQIVVFFIVFTFIMVNFLGQMSSPVINTSAAGLVGTWKTASPVTFHFKTDDMDTHEVIELGHEVRNVTLTITPTGDVSAVHVSMSYDVGASTVPQGAYYIHWSPPYYYWGRIDNGIITLNDGVSSIIHLTYAGASMTGTWDDNTMLGGFIQDEYIDDNGITLYRS